MKHKILKIYKTNKQNSPSGKVQISNQAKIITLTVGA